MRREAAHGGATQTSSQPGHHRTSLSGQGGGRAGRGKAGGGGGVYAQNFRMLSLSYFTRSYCSSGSTSVAGRPPESCRIPLATWHPAGRACSSRLVRQTSPGSFSCCSTRLTVEKSSGGHVTDAATSKCPAVRVGQVRDRPNSRCDLMWRHRGCQTSHFCHRATHVVHNSWHVR